MSSKRKPAVAGKPGISAPPLPSGDQAKPARELGPGPERTVTRYDGQGVKRNWFRLLLHAAFLVTSAVCVELLLDAWDRYLERSDDKRSDEED